MKKIFACDIITDIKGKGGFYMKFGMPALVECKNITECVEVAKNNSLDFVEINMSFPQYIPQNSDVGLYKRLAEKNGVFYTIHADEQLNPFDFNPAVADCYFGVMADSIDFAIKIGAPVINMHLIKGVYVTLPEKVILLTDVYKEEYTKRVKDFIRMCEGKIGNSGLKIAIENVDSNPFTESQTEALNYFMDIIKFNDANYGLYTYGDMSAIVTSGFAGWGFKVKTAAPSEYVIIDILNK